MKTLAGLADFVFFASLIPEESEPVRVAVVYHKQGAQGLAGVHDASPEEEDPPLAWDVTAFRPSHLTAAALAKFSRGLEYGTQLVVVGGCEREGDELKIEGIARRLPHADGGDVIRLAAPRPGVLAFEQGSREIWRFEAGQSVPPALDVFGNKGPIRTAIGKITRDPSPERLFSATNRVIRRLIHKMRATHAGGILAIMPEEPDETILSSVKYRRGVPSSLSARIRDEWDKRSAIINEMMRNALTDIGNEERRGSETGSRDAMHVTVDVASERLDIASQLRDAADVATDRLEAAIDDVAQLSAIDGAVLAGPGLAIYGAGYKISTPRESSEIDVVQALDVAMERTEAYDIHQHGTRHRAAVAFAYDNPGGLAFVVSEDGPVRCALRIEDHVAVWAVHISET